VAVLSPHPSWGCFPDTNGVTLGRGSNGKNYLFAANGGTDDVSVIDLEAALAGNKTPEIMRIPTQIGPWGITISPTVGGSSPRTGKASASRSRATPFRSSTWNAPGWVTLPPK